MILAQQVSLQYTMEKIADDSMRRQARDLERARTQQWLSRSFAHSELPHASRSSTGQQSSSSSFLSLRTPVNRVRRFFSQLKDKKEKRRMQRENHKSIDFGQVFNSPVQVPPEGMRLGTITEDEEDEEVTALPRIGTRNDHVRDLRVTPKPPTPMGNCMNSREQEMMKRLVEVQIRKGVEAGVKL
ncbi:hypothetical protein P154DRAFT_533377 [Amniculicola lignicola CBS 123094]|uniref:Uncharacterized protein n=1 Tax=Amniculicola lignicola CBS 123094 TaxID=1392246 RepID=A0A6A5WM95_9PLEO|nr:hypothetical protein P154DRAFT_533377 [Amniculicola lignicola CBS 123094]